MIIYSEMRWKKMEKIDEDYKRILGGSIQERYLNGQLTIKEREERKHNVERFMRESLMWLNFLCYELEKITDKELYEQRVKERNYHEQKLVEYILNEIVYTK